MKKIFGIPLFAAVLGGGTATVVLMIGAMSAPPRFVARAAFTINWKEMPSVPNDELAAKVGKTWKWLLSQELTGQRTDTELTELFKSASQRRAGSESNGASPVRMSALGNPSLSALKSQLHVTMANESEDVDRFLIAMADDDPTWATTLVKCVLDDCLDRIKSHAQLGSGVAAMRSNANVEEIIARENSLNAEKRRLEKEFPPYPTRGAAAARYSSIRQELATLEAGHFQAGLGALVNLVDLFSDSPANVVEQAHAVPRGVGTRYMITALLAVVLGTTVGVAGIALRPILISKVPTTGATSRQPPQLEPVNLTREPPLLPREPPPLHGQPPQSGAKPPPLPPLI